MYNAYIRDLLCGLIMINNAGKILEEAILEANVGFTESTNGGRERVVRCFSCLDSDNPNHAHLSIGLVPPFYFQCHRCKFSGSVNEKFLISLGVVITPQIKAILEENRKAVITDIKSKGIEGTRQTNNIIKNIADSTKLRIPVIDRNVVLRNRYKYDYLCNRFNKKFLLEDLALFKTVFDIKELIRLNYIMTLPKTVDVMDKLNNDYIGFMNFANDTLINRIILNTDGERYYDLSFNKSSFRFYTFATKLDLTLPTLKLVVAEGIFDVIGLYNAFPKLRDCIFVAMLGHGINSLIKFFIKLGFLSQEIYLFSDDEIPPEDFKRQVWKYKLPAELKFKIHYMTNDIDHDYGVPAENIKVSKMTTILKGE